MAREKGMGKGMEGSICIAMVALALWAMLDGLFWAVSWCYLRCV